MKKYLWVVALVLSSLVASSLFAGTVPADSSRAHQDQAFLNQLAGQTKAPMSPVLVKAPLPVLSVIRCQDTYCQIDANCNVSCYNSGYCNKGLNRCVPY
jgi:hypothetical protein